ncbi:uncharacterized protein LOC123292750 [Chrysoperla carnea]|uniref:uncharacterized protein LOC123292750 n=1 Tax=Chrysoperla carnea TaxID=189513 RepID=UPI001D06AD4A|nr:uncharacterized protein LOC123292750 [Chrysoperla carnea]
MSRICKTTFDITLFSGCITDPDERLLNTDLIIALNVIEYLYPNILEALPYNIFEFSKPSIVILSTFNADLKYIFPSEVQFNSDKKFEWTRDQFIEWAYNITSRFPNYVVFFEGIGSLPIHPFINLGAFTEVAIFYKLPRNENSSNRVSNDLTSYGICTYMNYTDKHSNISDFKNNDPDTLSGYYYKYITSVYYNYNEKRLELPVTELYKSVRNLITMEELILLLKQYYVIENRLLDSTTIYLCVIWDLKNKPIDKLTAITKKGTTSDSDWETISIETVSQSRTSLPNSRLDIINSVTNPEVTENSSNKSVFTLSGGSGDQLSPELGAENEMLKKIQFDLMSKKRTNCKYFEKYPSAELNKYYSARYNQLKNCSSCSNISNTAIQNGDFNSGTSIASQYRPLTPIIESYKSSSSSR